MAENLIKQFITNKFNDGFSDDESISTDWNTVDSNVTWNENEMVDLANVGTNSIIVTSLFLRSGCFMVDSKDDGASTPFYTCCQPGFSAKQFHTPDDLQSYSSKKDSTQLPICAVVYKASQQTAQNHNNALVPMIFPAGGTSTFKEEFGTCSLFAEKAEKDEFKQVLNLLFPNPAAHTAPTPEKESSFKHLFQRMCQAFDLTTQKGWVKLLKKLLSDKGQVEVPTFASIKTLTLVTSLVFSSKININLALLTGEAPILAMKQKLLSAESPFRLLNRCQIASSLNLLEDDFGLDQAQLKECSFRQRMLFAHASESGCLKDLLMDHSLKIIKKGSSVFDRVDEDTDPVAYDKLHQSSHKVALEAVLATKKYNPHVRTILATYVDKKKKQMASSPGGATKEEDWDDLLARMFKIRFRPVTDRSKAPRDISWIINMMTQFDTPSGALALFSLLCNDKEVSIGFCYPLL